MQSYLSITLFVKQISFPELLKWFTFCNMEVRRILGRQVSGRQIELLWEYLNAHRDLATAYNRSLQAKENAKRKWREVADLLNSQGVGAHKDWKGWSKVIIRIFHWTRFL